MRARINRILALQSPGSGVLKRAGWVLAIAAAMPALYTAAAMQNRQPQVVSSQTSVPRILKVPDPATQSEPIQPVPTLPTQNFSDAIRSAEQQLRSGFDQSQFLSDIAKQAQIEALSKINEAQIQQNLLLSDPHSMDFLTQTNPPEGLPPDVVLPPNSFAFYVGGTSNQALLWTNARSGGETVSFRRAEGTVWNAVSYDCQACSFFVNEAGIGPESLGGAGILFTMEDTNPAANAAAQQPDYLAEPHASGDLTLTCRAKECWAIPMSAWGTSTAARIRFDVVKLRTPIADQSRVLIIVTR
jgi:hypothetical protein